MALVEVSGNINRRQSLKNFVAKGGQDEQSTSLQPQPPPLAVQHMLKSVTELGDVGEFCQRPSRVPRSSTNLTPQLRSHTPVNGHGISRRHSAHPNRARPFHTQPYFNPSRRSSRNSSIRSNISGHQYYPKSIRPHPGAGQQTYREHQQQEHTYNKIHTTRSYKSLTSLRSHDRLQINESSSLSSFQPKHSFPKRRPSMSAVSHTGAHLDSQPLHSGRRPRRKIATSSPNSLIYTGRSTQEYRSEYDQSAKAFRNMQFPLDGARISKRRPHRSNKSTTPLFTIPHNEHHQSTTSLASGLTSPTESIVPFYYDYSESFHGNEALPQLERNNSNTTQSPIHPKEPRSWSARTTTPVQCKCDPEPIELPTRHNRRASEISNRSRNSRRGRDRTQGDLANDVLKITELNELRSDMLSDSGGQNSNTATRNRFSPSNSTFFTNASRSPRNLSNLAARAHSPLDEDVLRCVRSIDGAAVNAVASSREHNSTNPRGMDSTDAFELPSLEFRPLSIGMSTDLRPRTSPVSVTHLVPEIFSPRPERPTSSHSRKRFIKILGIEQSRDSVQAFSLGGPSNTTPFGRLERVDEASSPLKTPDPAMVSALSTDKISHDKRHNNSGLLENNRWSGVTSHDKSTVESLLDKHIESLGLRPPPKVASITSTTAFRSSDWIETSEDSEFSRGTTNQLPQPVQTSDDISLGHRPTSLTSSAQECLVPRRLFASGETSFPNFPLASSESDIELPSSLRDNTIRPPYGWLPLHSEHILEADAALSKQTLLSGEFADIEDGKPPKRFKVQRHSSPDVTPVNYQSPDENVGIFNNENGQHTPCRRASSHLVSQRSSQQRRKMRIRLKTQPEDSSSSPKNGDDTKEQNVQQYSYELIRMGLARVPVSAVDGFAELSGESANASQKSLSPSSERQQDPQFQTWSEMMAAMPIPRNKTLGLRRKHSASTVRSDRSKNSVVSPINTSRATSTNVGPKLNPQNFVPQLAEPDLGLKLSASDFNLAMRSHATSPQHASVCGKTHTNFTSPRCQGQATELHWRLNSVHGITPRSMDNAAASIPQATSAYTQAKVVVSQDCRAPKRVSFAEEPIYPETVAMSDFAYRKHKIMEKLRG